MVLEIHFKTIVGLLVYNYPSTCEELVENVLVYWLLLMNFNIVIHTFVYDKYVFVYGMCSDKQTYNNHKLQNW